MPYKIVPTKTCSECGQVLESRRDDYCDGCRIKLSEKDYNTHIRLSFQTKDLDSRKEEMVFHSLGCFITNCGKVDLAGVRCVSLEFLSTKTFWEICSLLERAK